MKKFDYKMLFEKGENLQIKKDLVWTKTLLSVYRYLERVCDAIDKIVMKNALGCADITGQNYFQNNIYSVSQRIIDLSERKVTLINLKVLVEDTLKCLNAKEAKVLIEKYVDDAKAQDIAQIHDISIRTVFRIINNAEKSFSARLRLQGWSDLKLRVMIKDEMWIKNVFNQFSEKVPENFVFSTAYLAKVASM